MRKEEALRIAQALGMELKEKNIQYGTQYVFISSSGTKANVNVYSTGKIVYQGEENLRLQIKAKYEELQLKSKVYFDVPNYLLKALDQGSSDDPTILTFCIRETMTKIEDSLRSKLTSKFHGKKLIQEFFLQVNVDLPIRKEDLESFLIGLFGFRNYFAHNPSDSIEHHLSPGQLKLLLATSILAENLLNQILVGNDE